MADINIFVAFGAGIASFISPCCLPLYPSYLSYITGMSVQTLRTEQNKREVRLKTMLHTAAFILGFSAVFYTLGFGAGLFGELFISYRDLIRRLSAILIIVMGLFLLGIFKPQFLMKERKLDIKLKKTGYLASFVLGIGFSAGWSPCVGPILAVIISLAVSEPGTWISLITAYTMGFAVPFFILAFFIGSTKWITRYSSYIMKIGGALLLLMGILLFTNQMAKITIWLQQITPEWLKF